MSTQQACDAVGITLKTLYKLIDEGQLPASKFGRAVRLRTADVDAFVAGARIKPGSLAHLLPLSGRAAMARSASEQGDESRRRRRSF